MHSMTVSPSCYELWLYFAHWNWLFYPEDSSNEDRNLPAAGTQIEAVLQEINWTRTAAVCAGVMSPDLSTNPKPKPWLCQVLLSPFDLQG